jgi:outer membrane lipoprotein SlyB
MRKTTRGTPYEDIAPPYFQPGGRFAARPGRVRHRSNTGEQKVSRTAIGGVGGAGLGYLLGDLIGGKTARIVGAGSAASPAAVIGYRMDQQIRELDEATAGSGVDVSKTPDGESILVNLPDVTFAVDSTTISPSFRAALDEVASSLQKYPDSLVDVMGPHRFERIGQPQPRPVAAARRIGQGLPGDARRRRARAWPRSATASSIRAPTTPPPKAGP